MNLSSSAIGVKEDKEYMYIVPYYKIHSPNGLYQMATGIRGGKCTETINFPSSSASKIFPLPF